MKPTIEKIKLRFVYKVRAERQINMFTNQYQNIEIAEGCIHFFEIVTNDGMSEIIVSMCGLARADIAERTKDSDKRPPNLSVCKECEDAWKKDPRSNWSKWEKRKPI